MPSSLKSHTTTIVLGSNGVLYHIMASKQQQTWEQKFYQLADLFLNEAVLANYLLHKAQITRGEALSGINKDLGAAQVEGLEAHAKGIVASIIEGDYKDAESKPQPAPKPALGKVTELKSKEWHKIDSQERFARLREERARAREAMKAEALKGIPKEKESGKIPEWVRVKMWEFDHSNSAYVDIDVDGVPKKALKHSDLAQTWRKKLSEQYADNSSGRGV